jgi:predicted RNase H-like HicB family nuclease
MNSTTPPRRRDAEHPIAHYVALLMPTEIGEWRVLFPDVSECEARGFTVQDATYAATTALARCADTRGEALPIPRSLIQIESDGAWFKANGVALKEAVVTMVPLWPTRDCARP